jgi:dodecin
MSIVKVIEVIAEGKTIDEAVHNALKEASMTINDIKQIDIEHIYAKVENNKILGYRINCDISFVIHHNK